jgi:hypothetical protein
MDGDEFGGAPAVSAAVAADVDTVDAEPPPPDVATMAMPASEGEEVALDGAALVAEADAYLRARAVRRSTGGGGGAVDSAAVAGSGAGAGGRGAHAPARLVGAAPGYRESGGDRKSADGGGDAGGIDFDATTAAAAAVGSSSDAQRRLHAVTLATHTAPVAAFDTEARLTPRRRAQLAAIPSADAIAADTLAMHAASLRSRMLADLGLTEDDGAGEGKDDGDRAGGGGGGGGGGKDTE